ncbi:bacteriophage lambda tail assembly I family protein [Escherichia coli 2731150]|nr:bacteriophage lambda tail assembly I family protein [Escherichia coli 2731150]
MTQTESAILAHARRCAPAESCGFVVSTPEGERYFPCVNISGEPEAYFRMSPEDWLQAEMQGEIVALVHSHPGGLPWLSEADRRLQVQSDLPWWLVCRGEIHKFRCVPHLTGRRFEHGVTDCYTLFRDAYHLAGIEMPDFHREDDWWRTVRISIWIIWRHRAYQVPLSAAQPGDVLLCCFGSSVPNHAAIYCGDGELLHHIPEQLRNERGIPTNGSDAHTPSGVTGHGRICLYGDLQRFGRRIDLRVKTGAEAIRALATQLPAFRQKLNDGWYQVRIAGRDAGETELSARLNEPLANGAVIHIVPRLAGAKSGGVFQVVLGAALIAVAWWNPVGWLGAAAVSGCMRRGQYDPGGVAQMLAPKARTPRQPVQITANRTPISPHWITWLPRAMFCRFCTVKCAWGRGWFLRRSARQTKGMVVRLW